MDDSAKEHLAQVSLPIRDSSGKVIGALTVGIKLN
jgi:DNA-binding IclR family transcriptional regulator